MKIEPVIFLPLHTRTPGPVVTAVVAWLSNLVITELASEIIRPVGQSWRQVGSGIAGLLNNPAGVERVLETYEN